MSLRSLVPFHRSIFLTYIAALAIVVVSLATPSTSLAATPPLSAVTIAPGATYTGWGYVATSGTSAQAWKWSATGWSAVSLSAGTPVWIAPWGGGWTWIWLNGAWHATATTNLVIWGCTAVSAANPYVNVGTGGTLLRPRNAVSAASQLTLRAGDRLTLSCANGFRDADSTRTNVHALVKTAAGVSGYVESNSIVPGTSTTPAPSPAPGIAVPSTIDRTGATDVTAALNNFVASVPNGSTINFPSGSTYLISQGIQFKDRSNLTFNGYGSKLKLSPTAGFGQLQSMFLLGRNYGGYWSGTNTSIVIRGFDFEASNPTPGVFSTAREGQHAIEVDNSSGVEIYDVTVHGVGGDAVKIGDSTNIHIHNINVHDAGRQGVSVISGSFITIENNTFSDLGYYALDVEPNLDTESATDITFRNNLIGSWGPDLGYGAGFVACGSGTAYNRIGNITVTGNTLTGGSNATLLSYFNQNQHRRLYNIVFTNNKSSQAASGPVLDFKSIDGLTVTGNSQPLRSGSLAGIINSTAVTYVP